MTDASLPDERTHALATEMLGEVAAEFDRVHSVERARGVGSVHEIVAPSRLRPALYEAVSRGLARVGGAGAELP